LRGKARVEAGPALSAAIPTVPPKGRSVTLGPHAQGTHFG
jgi:hypothetical protein